MQDRRQWRRLVPVALVVVAGLAGLSCYGQAKSRGVQDLASASTPPAHFGPYYALVIGNNDYKYLRKLQTAVNDANAVERLLRERYGFSTKLLRDATRDQVLTALNDYRRTLPEDSSLLIYYAGHGHHDPDTDKAYWLPVDAQPDNNDHWISADDITSDVKAIPSLHVLIISDSCYSGVLTRDADAAITPRERGAYLDKMVKSKSRTLMSSGGDEPVADNGAAGHSVFAGAILESLGEMEDDQFTAADLFQRFVQPGVAGRSEQVPQYSIIRNSNHGYGDFVFSRLPGTTAAAASTAGTTLAPIASGTAGGSRNKAASGSPAAPEGTKLGPDVVAGKDLSDFEFQQASEAFRLKQWDEAASFARKSADEGNAKAMALLGRLYYLGLGVPQDGQQAKQWYEESADAGYGCAMYMLGLYYKLGGYGIPKDLQQARRWYQKGADNGRDCAGSCKKELAFF